MSLVYYTSIKGEYLSDYAKNSTLSILHAYIDAHSQRLLDEYPEDVVQYISIL